ncbi:MAG: Fic family protein [Candidatus Gracilibacteria bacterium]|jgi:Fic family protein/DNA-binding XRE family transcriptional regulator
MTIFEKLKLIQRLSGFTQEGLAQKLGVSFVTLNSWINGKSKPRKKAEILIDEIYKEYTGQKIIPESVLEAKKKFAVSKSKKNKNILRTILRRPDLYGEFLLLLTYHTNSIEGSTLSKNETGAILFHNKVLPYKSLIEQIEVKNHQAAFNYLLRYLALPKSKNRITKELILSLHAILMNGIRDDAGFYRRHGVRIVGANLPTANYMKIPDLMGKLAVNINEKVKDCVKQVAKIHADFEKIHPFSDGNGRVGRLILAAMLIKANLPPAIIRREKKQLYYTFLNKAQLCEDSSLLEDFLCDAILEGLEIMS